MKIAYSGYKNIWTKRTKNLMCTIFFSYFVVKIDLIIENLTQSVASWAGNLTAVFHPWEGNLTG